MHAWGLYPWFPELGLELIHPDDLSIVQAFSPHCVVCEVVGEEDFYLVIRYDSHQIRVKPELFEPIPAPVFRFGQRVRTKPPRTLRCGVVCSIGWHYAKHQPYYLLQVHGKVLSGRYWTEELEAA